MADGAAGGGQVAIIGMSGRFPGAASVGEFWANLCAGKVSISYFSDAELRAHGVDPSMFTRPGYVPAKGILRDVDLFDAAFFGVSPREAELLDPQHRLFLECAWEALEDAGYDPGAVADPVGVYAGSGASTYVHNLYANPDLLGVAGGMQVMIGNDKDHVPTHVSYKFDLRGPSIGVQTACSTSLVATCLAYQGLLSYQCDLALAGGVLVSVPHVAGYVYREGGVLSPDGCCRPFDAAAAGTVEGNGVGVVVLKRLEEALADRDQIYAVIRGAAINNDGSAKVGYTAPGVDGQAEVIAMAQALADVDPATITYVEAHGTGTQLGDPIELAALTRVFQASTRARRFCAIGSVKANIGHLDPAAGVASLIKTALALKHALLPPCPHFTQPNPRIDFEGGPFYVNRTLSEWKAGSTPRRAGVSSFGIGGTNAHIVLEEPPPAVPSTRHRDGLLYILSARTPSALAAASARLAAHLADHPDLDAADVAYTLQVGRKPFAHRRALVAANLAEAARMLAVDGGIASAAPGELRERPVAFLFPGAAAVHEGMARDLYASEPVFRAHVDRCHELLGEREGPLAAGRPVPIIPGEPGWPGTRPSDIFPALFAVEYAMAQLWTSWGVQPRALLGHSLGEYTAAAVAGVFSLPDALHLAALRGQLFETLPRGAMLSVTADAASLRDHLDARLSIAALNAPQQCVVAGPAEAIAALATRLDERQIVYRRLAVEAAAHSPLVEPVLPALMAAIARLDLRPPSLPVVSSATGTWATAGELTDPAYWARHMRGTVRFADALGCLLEDGDWILLEMGPGRSLATVARQHPRCPPEQVVLSSMRHAQEPGSDAAALLNAAGRLWVAGTPIDWRAFHAHERCRRVSLPTYPFERQRFWIDPAPRATGAGASAAGAGPSTGPSRVRDPAEWLYVPGWRRTAPPAAPRSLSPPDGSWLVFRDDAGLAPSLARRLERAGAEVVSVAPGERFDRLGDGTYTLDPTRPEDYLALLGDLRSRGRRPAAVLHLWTVAPGEPLDHAAVAREQERGFYSLLWLVQACGAARLALPERIAVVSSGVQDVTGEEPLSPGRATVLSACTVIPQEHPGTTCLSVDIRAPSPDAPPDEELADHVFAEVTGEAADRFTAYRHRRRWVQTYEPLGSATDGPARVREGGVYVITGGLGRIGMVLAEQLARRARARLVLISRRPPPGAAEDRDATDDAASGGILHRLDALWAHGAEVVVAQADVERRDQMQRVVDDTVRRFGTIHGVIHAAGLTADEGFGPIESIEPAACARQFGPKVHGALVLEEVLRGRRLDFVVLCSSLSSVLGGLGFVAYAAANLFLDGLARHCGRTGLWVSINWEGWRFGEPADGEPAPGRGLDLALSSVDGADVFLRILTGPPVSQLLVSTASLPARVSRWAGGPFIAAKSASPAAPAISLHARPALATPRVAPRTEAERLIAGIWEATLGIEGIGVDDDFFELGGDSLIAIQLMARVCAAGKVKISLHRLFQAPTVAQLASAVEEALLDEVEALSDAEAERLLARDGEAGPGPAA